MACLALEIVALYFDVAESHLEGSLTFTHRGNLLLQGVLRIVGLGLALLVLCLPLLDLEPQALCLFLQLALPFLALFDIALELGLEFLARCLELLQLNLEGFILGLVVG
jgi:hypothetical protein